MKPDDANRIPTPEKPFPPRFFLGLTATDPQTARRLVREVLLAERSIPRGAAALGIAEGTLRRLRGEGWASNIRVRGRGRPREAAE